MEQYFYSTGSMDHFCPQGLIKELNHFNSLSSMLIMLLLFFSEFVLKRFINNAKRLDTGQVSLSQVSKSALFIWMDVGIGRWHHMQN